MKRVIGIVGPIASGKGTLISLLEEKGYTVLSLSDEVREKAKAWDLPHTRENLQNVGDKLRKQFGNAILVELVAQKMQKHTQEKFVIDAIRNPAEVQYLKKQFNAFIIGITATSEKRFELMQKRNREYDPTTWEDFLKAEKRDRGEGQASYGQQVEKCLALSNIVLDNNSDLDTFKRNVSYFLDTILTEN